MENVIYYYRSKKLFKYYARRRELALDKEKYESKFAFRYGHILQWKI
jgi:hypothetical protein